MSRTIFYCTKDVRAIEVRLYVYGYNVVKNIFVQTVLKTNIWNLQRFIELRNTSL